MGWATWCGGWSTGTGGEWSDHVPSLIALHFMHMMYSYRLVSNYKRPDRTKAKHTHPQAEKAHRQTTITCHPLHRSAESPVDAPHASIVTLYIMIFRFIYFTPGRGITGPHKTRLSPTRRGRIRTRRQQTPSPPSPSLPSPPLRHLRQASSPDTAAQFSASSFLSIPLFPPSLSSVISTSPTPTIPR